MVMMMSMSQIDLPGIMLVCKHNLIDLRIQASQHLADFNPQHFETVI